MQCHVNLMYAVTMQAWYFTIKWNEPFSGPFFFSFFFALMQVCLRYYEEWSSIHFIIWISRRQRSCNKIIIFFFNYLKTALPNMNIYRKTPKEIHYICLGYKEMYSIFKTCCIILVFSLHNATWFTILPFSLQI